jgi:preprotein translocase subunit YajC
LDIIIALAPQGGDAGGGSLISTLIMFAAIFAIFYFMIIRPQQKRAKEREKLLSNIEKGDKIVTTGGVHATIVGIDEKTVLIEIAPNVKIKVDRSAIGNVIK